ncbi:MAG: hypothetical protein CVU92_04735 [Firmicutes bacterium HGW-Firmicutes-17]|jgi:transcriptional regulator with XRE-family HTH domain|nr:MAG: hypothetical protein CVU92_04735 [Firmicutes bacterium HGW-Firmicutes-17]
MLGKIRTLCTNKGMSIGGLEKELGFGNGSIFKWGASSPSVDRLQKVADYFGVTVDFLLSDCDISQEAIFAAKKFDNLSENQKQAVMQIIDSYSCKK